MAKKLILAEGVLGGNVATLEPLKSVIADGYEIESVSGFVSKDNRPMCFVVLDEVPEEITEIAAPVFSPSAEETFADSVDVTISCATEGASIYYSTDDGATFDAYEGAITLDATTTIVAIAALGGIVNNETATYTKAAAETQDTTEP